MDPFRKSEHMPSGKIAALQASRRKILYLSVDRLLRGSEWHLLCSTWVRRHLGEWCMTSFRRKLRNWLLANWRSLSFLLYEDLWMQSWCPSSTFFPLEIRWNFYYTFLVIQGRLREQLITRRSKIWAGAKHIFYKLEKDCRSHRPSRFRVVVWSTCQRLRMHLGDCFKIL